MKTQIYTAKTGAWVAFDRESPPCGMYAVRLYDANDELLGKMRCDTRSGALQTFQEYKEKARTL